MGRYSEPPFERGLSYFNGGLIDTSDLTNIGGEILEGREYDFDDTLHGSGATVRCRVVRNMSATPVTAKQLLKPDASASTAPGRYIGRVNGVTDAAAIKCFVADELLPSGGIPQYDLFYVVTEGPCLVVTPTAGVAVSIGNYMVSSTTGRATTQDLSGATTALGGNIQNRIGEALSALTSGQTAADCLVNVARW